MANEYGRWFVRNDPQTWQQNFGAYQRPFGERFERPSEYTPSVEAYKNYPAMLDVAAEQEKKKEQLQQQDNASKRSNQAKQQSRTAQNAGRNAGNIVKNIASKAVAVVGGGAVVVAGYEAIVAAQTPEPAPIVQFVEADWEAWDGSEFTIMVQLKDAEGNVIKEIPAVITMTEIEATCTKAGTQTYTATAKDGEETYTDSYDEPIAAKGHTFDAGKAVTLGEGHSGMVFECTECHEQFTVDTSIEENE